MYVAELARGLLELDAAAAHALNAATRRFRFVQQAASLAASGLAGAEIVLMLGVAARGHPRTALRMVSAVGSVYVACEILGRLWRRERPFVGLEAVQELVEHHPERSFPSRHVASGLAMAVVGGSASPGLGRVMAGLAWLLGLSRVAVGLHYPSDVLGGAVLGTLIGSIWGYGRRT